MKRPTYVILGLLLVMMAIVYFVNRPEDIEATYTVPDIQITLNPASIVRMEIERERQYVRLERIRDVWKITEPVRYIADDEAISALVDGIAKFRLMRQVSSNPEKQKIFLVDNRGTKFKLTNDDGKKLSFIIGKEDPSTKQTFLRLDTSNTVYLIQGISPAMINREVKDWRQRTIYRIDPGEIKQISIQRGGNKVVVQRQGNQWVSEGVFIPSTMMNSTLKAISYLRAEDFIDTSLIVNASPELRVEVSAASQIRMDVYPNRANYSQHLVKTSLSPNMFVIGKAATKELVNIGEYLYTPPAVTSTQPEQTTTQTQPVQPPPTKPSWATPGQRQQITPVQTTPVQAPPAQRTPTVQTPPVRTSPTRTTPPSQQPQQTRAPQTSRVATNEDEGDLIIHTVIKGETITTIAQKYKVTVEQIVRWNLLKAASVRPGQDLYIFVR